MDGLHVHIYDNESSKDDNLVEEIDLTMLDEYEDYFQYGFERNGEWFEIRVPK